MTAHTETPQSKISGLSRLRDCAIHCFRHEKESLIKWGIAGGLTALFTFNSGVSIFTPDLSEALLGKCTGDIEIPADQPSRATHCALWLTSTPGVAIGRALNNY